MTTQPPTTIAERRRQWQQLPADQKLQRVHRAAADLIEIARWRRQQRQRLQTNDFLFIKEA